MTIALHAKALLGRWSTRAARARRVGSAVALLGALLSVPASATPEYPLVLDATFATQCPNPNSRCVICHTSARGGQATAVRPFAQTLRRYGLTRGRDATALQQALAMLPETTDSDGDGAPDEEELILCGNPSGEDLGSGPEYGCDGARLAPSLPSDAPLALMALLTASVLVRRRAARPSGDKPQRR